MKQLTPFSSLIALSVASLYAAPALAQTQDQTPPSNSPDPAAPVEGEIVVSGVRAALISSANEKKNADDIRDVVTAEDIGKFPDENIADSLARVPGVQITRELGEGNGFTIRGISQNRVSVNGRTTIGRDEGRGASLGDLSSDLLGRLEVIKSPTADQVEGSLGGTVNLVTRRPFDFSRPETTLSARQGYTTNAGDFQPNVSGLVSRRWDTGIGEIGVLLNASYAITRVSEDRANLNGWVAACNFDLNKNGVVSTARPTDTNDDGVDDTCVDQGDFAFRPSNLALVDTYSDRERIGGVASLQWRPSDALEFYFDGNYNTYNEDEKKYSLFQSAVPAGNAASNIRSLTVDEDRNMTSVVFVNRRPRSSVQSQVNKSDTYNFAFGGKWEGSRLRATGEVAYSAGKSDLAFTSINTDTRDANGVVTMTVEGDLLSIEIDDQLTSINDWQLQRFTSSVVQVDSSEKSARLDFDWDTAFGPVSSIEFGGRWTAQDYDRDLLRYISESGMNPTPAIGQPVVNFPRLVPYFITANLPGFFSNYPELTFPKAWGQFDPNAGYSPEALAVYADLFNVPAQLPHVPEEEYFLSEETRAAYVKVNYAFPIGGIEATGNFGVRYVATAIDSNTDIPDSTGTLSPLDQSKSYDNWLPSANAMFNFGDGYIFRLAYAKTMVRPSFAQLRPALSLNFAGANGTIEVPYAARGGNPLLDPFEATQYDISLEKYFGRGNMISIAGYYRDVGAFIRNRTIEGVLLPNGFYVDLTIPENGSNATVKGFEVTTQTIFSFLPGIFRNLGLTANYTYADSKTQDRDRFGNVLELEGLSKHTYNVSGFYEDDHFSARLSYNWRDTQLLTAVGQAGRPVYRTPDEQLDLSLGWNVNDQFRVSFDARNLTARLGREYNEAYSAPTRILYDDTKYTLGIRVKM